MHTPLMQAQLFIEIITLHLYVKSNSSLLRKVVGPEAFHSSFDAEQVDNINENVELFAAIGTKIIS